MAERGIGIADVKRVYERPEMTYDAPNGDHCRSCVIEGRRIKIVVVQGTDRIKTVIDQIEGV
jgi:hypothetical protein